MVVRSLTGPYRRAICFVDAKVMLGNDEYHEDGAFARYITAKGDMLMRIPDGVGFESAATVAVGIGTLGYGLYHILGLPLPDDSASHSSEPVLVYGGSTATGTLAVQFAKLHVLSPAECT